jgi:sulfur-oxidizing protein SoxY
VDNGNVVPITITVDSPMSDPTSHVKAIALFNENPQRGVVKFPESLPAAKPASAFTSPVDHAKLVAVAQMTTAVLVQAARTSS